MTGIKIWPGDGERERIPSGGGLSSLIILSNYLSQISLRLLLIDSFDREFSYQSVCGYREDTTQLRQTPLSLLPGTRWIIATQLMAYQTYLFYLVFIPKTIIVEFEMQRTDVKHLDVRVSER